jgi:hypothetical protein
MPIDRSCCTSGPEISRAITPIFVSLGNFCGLAIAHITSSPLADQYNQDNQFPTGDLRFFHREKRSVSLLQCTSSVRRKLQSISAIVFQTRDLFFAQFYYRKEKGRSCERPHL